MTRTTVRLCGIALAAMATVLTTRVGAAGAPTADIQAAQHASHAESSSSRLVDQVREATDMFRRAIPDEYKQFLGCVSGPEEGAMGVHFVNSDLVDGKLEVNRPEALIYEVKSGRARLVGVEVHRPGRRLDSRPRRTAGAGAGGTAVPLQ